MSYTEKQRKYFNAAAARGEKGMSSLASEANALSKKGKELPPVKYGSGGDVRDVPVEAGVEYEEKARGEPEHEELPPHVVELEGGGYACMHCGGETYAHGGSVMPHPEMANKEDEAEPPQYEAEEQRRANAFADAVSYARHSRGQP